MELIRERIYKFGRNTNSLLWRQEKLLNMFRAFEKSLEIYIDNQNYLKEHEKDKNDQKKKSNKIASKSKNQKPKPDKNHLYEDSSED